MKAVVEMERKRGGGGERKAGADSWTNRECVAVVERSVGDKRGRLSVAPDVRK